MAEPAIMETLSAYSLPHSEETERAVLGAVLVDPTLIENVASLAVEDFFGERHKFIFSAMLTIHAKGAAVDMRTVQAELEKRDQLEKLGGVAYLASLDLELPDVGRLDTYVDVVRECSTRRRLIAACGDITRNCLDGGYGAGAALALAESAIANIKPPGHSGRLRLVTAASIIMTRPEFVWQSRVPIGGVTMFAGVEGQGKTLATIAVAAKATRGTLEGDLLGISAHVVFVGSEDDWSSMMKPRLSAAGADLDRVHFVKLPEGGIFAVEQDVVELENALGELDRVALVVIDPLDAHLGDNVDSHRKSEVQRSISRLAGLAQRQRCAVIGIGHLNKNEISKDLLVRVIGSRGFTTSPRSVLGVGPSPGGDGSERMIVLAKSNLRDKSAVPALRFRIEGREVPHDDGGTVETAAVAWLGEAHGVDPNTIICIENAEERTEREEAADWLRDLLEDGQRCPCKEIERLASEAGISRATLHRARKLTSIRIERDESARGRPSTWSLVSASDSLS